MPFRGTFKTSSSEPPCVVLFDGITVLHVSSSYLIESAYLYYNNNIITKEISCNV